jgi:hypothetical protein
MSYLLRLDRRELQAGNAMALREDRARVLFRRTVMRSRKLFWLLLPLFHHNVPPRGIDGAP